MAECDAIKHEAVAGRRAVVVGMGFVGAEGGPSVIASVLTAGVAHRVIAMISPRILGHGPHILGDLRQERVVSALPLDCHSVHLVDGTIIVAADIAGPSQPSPNGQAPVSAQPRMR